MDSPAPTPTRTARKSGSQKRQRSHLAGMFCTPEERTQLEERAERAGLSVAAYMRHQCLGEAGPRAVRRAPVERKALAQLLGQIGKVGGNVNQIARALNSDRELPHDIDGTLAEVREASRAILAVMQGKPL